MRRIARRTKVALVAIATLALLTVLAIVLWKNVFVVANVIVEGDISIEASEVIRAAQIELGTSIQSVEKDRIRKNVNSTGILALEDVEIQYPNTVVLFVRERTRDAMVLNGGRLVVMDSDGYVVETSSVVPDNGCVYITDLECGSYEIGQRISAPEEKLEAMKIVLDAIRAQNAGAYVSELSVKDLLNLQITTRTGIRVQLGDVSDMEGKILWMRSAVADLESRGQTSGTLDVSSGTKADYRP